MNSVAAPSPDLRERLGSPELLQLVQRFVRRRVPPCEVDDVVQTVLCDALAASNVPQHEEALRKWMVGISRHKVADYHRRQGRARWVELGEHASEQVDPVSAREWARWATRQTDGDPEARRTLGWMAREGGGEKLAQIAAEEQVSPVQVRQRVSRLRRWMRQRWAAEVAVVAVVMALAVVVVRGLFDAERPPEVVLTPVPEVAPTPLRDRQRARALRSEAYAECERGRWQACLRGLQAAGTLDPVGDEEPKVRQERERAQKALQAPPSVPTTQPSVEPSAAPRQRVEPPKALPPKALQPPAPQQSKKNRRKMPVEPKVAPQRAREERKKSAKMPQQQTVEPPRSAPNALDEPPPQQAERLPQKKK